MFTNLKRGLRQGETIPGTPTFERAGTVRVGFDVQGIDARGPGEAGAPAGAGQAMPGMDM